MHSIRFHRQNTARPSLSAGSSMNKLVLVLLFMLLGSLEAQAQVASNECKPGLWHYVYSQSRFSNDNTPSRHQCVAVKGRITKVWPREKNSDGDIHISVDPDYMRLGHGQSHLVVEVICAEPAVRGDAKTVCEKFQRAGLGHPLALGRKRLNELVGAHVIVIGELVTDYGHNKPYGLREVHPVTKINKIP